MLTCASQVTVWQFGHSTCSFGLAVDDRIITYVHADGVAVAQAVEKVILITAAFCWFGA